MGQALSAIDMNINAPANTPKQTDESNSENSFEETLMFESTEAENGVAAEEGAGTDESGKYLPISITSRETIDKTDYSSAEDETISTNMFTSEKDTQALESTKKPKGLYLNDTPALTEENGEGVLEIDPAQLGFEAVQDREKLNIFASSLENPPIREEILSAPTPPPKNILDSLNLQNSIAKNESMSETGKADKAPIPDSQYLQTTPLTAEANLNETKMAFADIEQDAEEIIPKDQETVTTQNHTKTKEEIMTDKNTGSATYTEEGANETSPFNYLGTNEVADYGENSPKDILKKKKGVDTNSIRINLEESVSNLASKNISDTSSTSAPKIREGIVNQVKDNIQFLVKNGNEKVVVKINPPELGSLEIKVQRRGNKIDISMTTETTALKNSLESQLSLLKEALSAKGIITSQFNVSVGSGGKEEKREMNRFTQGSDRQDDNKLEDISKTNNQGREHHIIPPLQDINSGSINLFI